MLTRRVVVLSLLALLLVPVAHAGLIDVHDFSLSPAVLVGDQTQNGSKPKIPALLTGAAEASGHRRGLFIFVDLHDMLLEGADQVDVINTVDESGALDRARSGQCRSAGTCSVEKTFRHPRGTVLPGSDAILYFDTAEANFTLRAPFAITTLLRLPKDLGGKSLQNLEFEQSLVAAGDELHAQGNATVSTGFVFLKFNSNESRLTLAGDEGEGTYSGTRYIFRFAGPLSFTATADGIILPFAADATLRLEPTTRANLDAHFKPENVNKIFGAMGSNATILGKELADNLQPLAPVLNGVVLGDVANASVGGKAYGNSSFALVRFQSLFLVPTAGGGAQATGRSTFVVFGGGLYTTEKGVDLGPLQLPYLSLVLWVLAAGAIVAAFLLKPIVGLAPVGGFGTVRLTGWIFHAVALVIAFILWDREVAAFLGTSFLTLFAKGASGSGPAFLAIVAAEFFPLAIAHFAIGMPLRFIVNSGLKLGGLQRARGIGKGIGNLATWGLGAPFIPFFLNGLLGFLLDAAQKALSG